MEDTRNRAHPFLVDLGLPGQESWVKAHTLQITLINSVSNNLRYWIDYLHAFRSHLGDYNGHQMLQMFKIVSFGIMVRFIKLDVLFWVYACINTRATINQQRSTDSTPLYTFQDIICYWYYSTYSHYYKAIVVIWHFNKTSNFITL